MAAPQRAARRSPSPSELDPLIPANSFNPSSSSSDSLRRAPINPNNLTNLETAVNDVYEAIVDDDEDYDNSTCEDIIWLREQRSLNKSLHWFKRPSVMMVAFIPFLFALANSSGESTRQIITYKLSCNYLSNGQGNCNPAEAQIVMSNLQLSYNIASGIITLIASGKVGPYSDQYGRKLFICLILCFLVLGRFVRFLIMYNFTSLQFGFMVLTEILSNLCGGVLTLVTITNCYISDVVEPHERIYSLGFSLAALYIGLSVGPVIGNLILSLNTKIATTFLDINTTISREEFVPLKFELIMFFLGLLFAFFVLPESRSEKARKKSRSMSISSSSSLELAINGVPEPAEPLRVKIFNAINFLKPLKLLLFPNDVVNRGDESRRRRERTAVIILVMVDCFLSALAISLGELFAMYGIYVFGWNQRDIGHLLAIACSSKAIVLLVLSPIINHRLIQKTFGFKVMKKQLDMVDFCMGSIGLFTDAITLTAIAFARTTNEFFVVMIFTSFGSLASPTLNSAIIKFYPESKIGELFGAMALLKNIFTILGPVVFISLYKYSLSQWNRPQVVFMVAGCIFTICALGLVSVKWILGLNRFSEPESFSRSNSVASIQDLLVRSKSFSSTNTPVTKSSSDNSVPNSPSTTLPHKPFSELHRKSSFIHKERSKP
ncbi:major facilitator superfamily domain-containing protein [Scheffersomyces xylosifermentans]|uniref:major facilitator superfamily domain-containing protein n=1 Tax=Scheffersomyces xylosifermentans TaxID=1304137 RepID=UPI00315C84ED